jgi:tRNA(Ile)-lysidine synthase
LLKHGADALLLAHHQDDQAETLLLQLLRGAGVEGLSAMSAVGKMGITPILRPLLDVSRVVLQNYAQQHGLQWVEDESNQDARFDRNFLRLEVLPLLKTRFPACVTTLARSAANFADSAEILQQLAEEDAGGDSDAGRLDLTILKNLPPPRAVNVLRWWIYNASGQKLSRSRLLEIYSQLVGARAEARIECVLGSVVLRRYRQWAVIDCGAAVESYRLEWHGDGALSLPDGSRLVLEKSWGKGLPPQLIANGLLVTNRAGKPANGRLEMRLGACGKMRTLKNLWQEAGVPMWERDRMPLLWIDGSLAAVPGLGVSTDLAVGGDVAGVIPGWVND